MTKSKILHGAGICAAALTINYLFVWGFGGASDRAHPMKNTLEFAIGIAFASALAWAVRWFFGRD